MNVIILNGSPKGEYSITLQTLKYLALRFPEHTFETVHVGQKIRAIEKNIAEVVEKIQKSDLVIFSYPVYTFIAPYQLHRFIELLKESGASLDGKCVTQITTSKHFYDITAHRYIEDNVQDLNMNYIRGLSADMDDLLTEKGRAEAEKFFSFVMWSMKERIFEPKKTFSTTPKSLPVTIPEPTTDKIGDVVIVTNCEENDEKLRSMIERFQNVSKRNTRVVNIREFGIKGGCLGCFNCAVSGKCVYKDGFDDFLRGNIQTAEAMIYAFTIKDHSMGASFKLFDDRQFCNGHRTVTMGMPVGYIVSGNYSEEYNLQTIVEGRAEVGGNYLLGVATDEFSPNEKLDELAKALDYALENKYTKPQNFLGVGGMKIFRDLIWLMQGMMKADHKFYKKHGQYDFPQKKRGTILKMYLVGALISSPKLKAKMGNKMNEGMLLPYKKLFDSLEKK